MTAERPTEPTYYTDADVADMVGKTTRTVFSWRKARRPVHGLRVVQVGTVERWVTDPACTAYLDDDPPIVLSRADDVEAGAHDTRNREGGSCLNTGGANG